MSRRKEKEGNLKRERKSVFIPASWHEERSHALCESDHFSKRIKTIFSYRGLLAQKSRKSPYFHLAASKKMEANAPSWSLNSQGVWQLLLCYLILLTPWYPKPPLFLSMDRRLRDLHSQALVLKMVQTKRWPTYQIGINAFKTYHIQAFFFFFPSSNFMTIASTCSLDSISAHRLKHLVYVECPLSVLNYQYYLSTELFSSAYQHGLVSPIFRIETKNPGFLSFWASNTFYFLMI